MQVTRLSGNYYNGKAPRWVGLFGKLGSNHVEGWLRVPIIFTLVVIYQGLFSGNAFKIPARLQRVFDSPMFRFFSVLTIALSAVADIEIALVSTVLFYGIMWMLMTPAERRGDESKK